MPPSLDPPASSEASPKLNVRLDRPAKAFDSAERKDGLLGVAGPVEERAPSPSPYVAVAGPDGEIGRTSGKYASSGFAKGAAETFGVRVPAGNRDVMAKSSILSSGMGTSPRRSGG